VRCTHTLASSVCSYVNEDLLTIGLAGMPSRHSLYGPASWIILLSMVDGTMLTRLAHTTGPMMK
jgi:hypothetical protein